MIFPLTPEYSVWSYALLFTLMVLFPLMALQNARVRDVDHVPRLTIYLSSCAVLWALFLAATLVLAVEELPFAQLGAQWTLGLNENVVWTLSLLLYSLGIAWSAQALRTRFGLAVPPILARVLPETAQETIAFLLIVCPTAGITEEILFRGFAITRLAQLVGDWWIATLIAATGFALGHAYQGAIGMVSTALIGLGYSVAFIYTGSLVPAIAAHMLHNALSALLFRFEPS